MHIVRQNTEPRGPAQEIYINGELTWEVISDNEMETNINTVLSDYITRTDKIDTIVNLAISNRLYGVIIDFRGISDEHHFERFLIELAPRLREIGIGTGVRLANHVNTDAIKNIVDYIVK